MNHDDGNGGGGVRGGSATETHGVSEAEMSDLTFRPDINPKSRSQCPIFPSIPSLPSLPSTFCPFPFAMSASFLRLSPRSSYRWGPAGTTIAAAADGADGADGDSDDDDVNTASNVNKK